MARKPQAEPLRIDVPHHPTKDISIAHITRKPHVRSGSRASPLHGKTLAR